MPVPDSVVDIWMEEVRRTGSLVAACRRIGVSQQWYRERKLRSPEFAKRMLEARYERPARIARKVLDGIEYGFPSEHLGRDGEVVSLRKHCPKMTSLYMAHVHGWGQKQDESADIPTKQVQLITRDGQEVPLIDMLRSGVEEKRGTTIAAPRPDVLDVEAIEVDSPEADSGD